MRVLILIIFSGCGLPLLAEDGKLERAKKEVRSDPPKPSNSNTGTTSHTSNNNYSNYNNDDDDFGFFDMLADIGHLCFVWGKDNPNALVGSTSYPYYNNYPGYYAPVDLQRENSVVGGALYAEGCIIEDNLQRYSAGGHVSFSAFSIRSDWQRYFEERTNGTYDTLNIGTIDCELAIVTVPYLRVNIGAGALIYHDNIGTESGGAVMANALAFPFSPCVIEGAFTYGSVIDTDVMITRLTAGAMWRQWEGYAGWHYTKIGSATLDGPLLGVRFWY